MCVKESICTVLVEGGLVIFGDSPVGVLVITPVQYLNVLLLSHSLLWQKLLFFLCSIYVVNHGFLH